MANPDQTIELAPSDRYLNLWQSGKAPDLQSFLVSAGSISADQLVAVIRVDQRERWQRGERHLIESYLQLDPVRKASPDVPLDLILSEVLLREDLHEKPSLEEYVARFPQHQDSLGKLFNLHDVLRSETSAGHSTQDRGAAEPTDAPPAQIGKYRIVQTLGEGGQGVVYRAVHPTLGKDVIIKWSRKSISKAAGDRLQDEGRILAELDHPNLARVYDMDIDGDHLYLVMEYVRGKTLEQWAQETRPDARQAVVMVAQIARALAVAHRRGVAHLDIKPRNIIIDEHGQAHIIDFGLAQMRDAFSDDTQPSGGTIAYMAPEQATSDPTKLGPRTDVFTLGGVLFYLLTGKAPYHALSRAQQGLWDRAALDGAAAPKIVKQICAKAMEPDPDRRYANARALAEDLERLNRKPRFQAIAIAALVLICGGVLLAILSGRFGGKSEEEKRKDLTATSAKIPMNVRVWRNKLFVDLVDAAPLVTGDEVQLHTAVPGDYYAAVFVLDSEGKLKHLASRERGRDSRFSFPPDGTAPLTGEPGTEFIFLVARRSRPITLADVESLWGTPEAWPALPGQTVLRISGEVIAREGKSRGLGTTKARIDPEAVVRQKLAAHAERFLGHVEVFTGIAFAHQE